METLNMIKIMHENPIKLMEICIELSKIKHIDKGLSEKQRWYLLTAYEVKKNPDKLSFKEKEEFLSTHLKLVFSLNYNKKTLENGE